MSGGYRFDLIQLLHKIQNNMPTSNDYPYNLNPAYQKERKTETGTNEIVAPICDPDGDIISSEIITFDFEQSGRDMIVYLPDTFNAHRDDVTNMIQDLYKNFNIEYK
jgi:hypothetical protein